MIGWKLVPVEPTRHMIDAGELIVQFTSREELRECYQTMLDEAPDAPAVRMEADIEEFSRLIDAYQRAQDGSVDDRAKARIALMDAYRGALCY